MGCRAGEDDPDEVEARRLASSESSLPIDAPPHVITRLQFHWQEYSDKGYLTALSHLNELRKEGHIRAIGLCNFDTIHTDEICTQLGPGVIVSNQVQVCSRFDCVSASRFTPTSPKQFSLIDTRPLHGMSDVCAKHNLKLLTYGTLVRGLALSIFYYDRVLR